MPDENSKNTCNPEFDAACARFNDAMQDYFKTATAALSQYVKTVEESAARLRESQQAILDILLKGTKC
jgi:hypothetical protein